MGFIKQDSVVDVKKIDKLLSKYGKMQVGINSQSIIDDIENLKRMAESSKNKDFVRNCWGITDYLNNLRRNKGNIDVAFKYDSGKVVSSPIDIRKFLGMNIQTTDYLNLLDKTIIVLDYSELINGLSLDIGYHDLGYTHSEIENKLKDIGMVATYGCDELGDLLEDRLYMVLYGLMIEDSSYLTPDGRGIFNYFGDRVDDRRRYRSVLESTSSKMMSIITQNILQEVDDKNYKVELAAVYYDSIVLMVDKDSYNDTMVNDLAIEVVTRIFGRKFLFKPQTQVY